MSHLVFVSLLVRDYDEAIAFFTHKLGFTLIGDTPQPEEPGKRWVLVAPPGAAETRLLLMKATTAAQLARVGDQTGGRVAFFLHTENFQRDYAAFRLRGVTFLESPRSEGYGTVAVFTDLYGNKWDLLELKPEARR